MKSLLKVSRRGRLRWVREGVGEGGREGGREEEMVRDKIITVTGESE